MKIADVHRQEVATVRPTTSLRNVARLMEETDTGLPVVSDGELVGVVSMRDLFALETFLPGTDISSAREVDQERELTAARTAS